MFKLNRSLAVAAGCVALAAVAAAADTGWRDVLDTPAAKSPLAARTLVNGLASAGKRFVAVGNRGHVLLSDDAGKTWQQAEVPVSSDLVAVSFPSATTGWAVGHDGIVLHSTDAGATWTRRLDGVRAGEAMVEYYTREQDGALAADPKHAAAVLEDARRFAAQGDENPFLDVWFENEMSGYVVGAFGLVLHTTDGGKTWQPMLHAVDNPKALHLYAVRGIGADVYIAGEQGLLLKLDRASGRFRALELPYKGTLFGAIGNSRALVVFGLRGTVLRSADSGRTWQTVDTGVQAGLTAGTLDADGRFVIVSQAGHVLVSRDEGATFKLAQVERPLPAAAVIGVAQNTVLVGGPRGIQTQTLP
ncbi:MAG TPA: YCF48-related protein [Burkholderiaceae bacterium]|nr:YCF48-related protein [Burkholderiaceae bacterium]